MKEGFKIDRWQPYAWNGTKYVVISVPVYKTENEAINSAKAIVSDTDNHSVMISVRKHYKEKPIIAKNKKI